jgi:ribonuclease BN (tRNA processing enzyme)
MTALVSLARAGIEPDEIDAVVVSHLHGDHFGGLAPLLLDVTQRPRTRTLTLAGPAALRGRLEQALTIFGWTTARVDVATYVTLAPGEKTIIAACEVSAFEVPHNPATSPTGLRLSVNGVTIGYSGDAGWSPALLEIANNADLFVCGVWSLATPDASFVDLATLERERSKLSCRRLILTHLGPELLAHAETHSMPFDVATDGLTIEL